MFLFGAELLRTQNSTPDIVEKEGINLAQNKFFNVVGGSDFKETKNKYYNN